MNKYISYILNVILIIVVIFAFCNSCNNFNNSLKDKSINETLQDSLYITKNKLNEQTATTMVLVADRNILKQQKDSMYLRLKAIDKYYKRKLVVATSLDLVTKDTSIGATNITPKDTIRKGNIVEIYPEYSDTIEKKLNGKLFATYMIRANKDSIKVISSILNPIDIDYRYDKKNFFDRKHLVVDIKTINPNSGVVQMKSYMPPEKKRTSPFIILGIGIVTGFILNSQLR